MGRARYSLSKFDFLTIGMNDIPQPTQPTQSNMVPAAIVIAGLIIAGAVVYSKNPQPGSAIGNNTGNSAQTPGKNPNERVQVSVDDDAVKGDANAPITIIEFSDFQCPFCKRFFDQTLPQIDEKYIKTGKAKLVYRDFPLTSIHEFAAKAGEGAECAREQGKFWEFHDRLFQRQEELKVEDLKKHAADLGLNTVTFNQCLDSGKYTSEVDKDLNEGVTAGVTGTPTFFINGVKVVGAVPFSQFEQIIEAELNK